jgi:hypothetical protein
VNAFSSQIAAVECTTRIPALQSPLEAKLRETGLRAFYAMWFEQNRERDEEPSFSVHTASRLISNRIHELRRDAAADLAQSKKFTADAHWFRLWHERRTWAADAFEELLYGDMVMFRVRFAEVRRAQKDIDAEQVRLWPEMAA